MRLYNRNIMLINTKEKIFNLLQETYTSDIRQRIYDMFQFEVIDGQLYTAVADLVTRRTGNHHI